MARLWLLVAPVLLLVAYLVAQRARQRAVVRFTDVDLLSSVAPTRTGWQRHIGAGLLLLTLVLLTVGLRAAGRDDAHAAEERDRDPRARHVGVDGGRRRGAHPAGGGEDRGGGVRPRAAERAEGRPGVVRHQRAACSSRRPPTATRCSVAIAALQTGAGTATADAIDLSLAAIRALPKTAAGKQQPAAIVLMSDGSPTIGRNGETPTAAVDEEATTAKRTGVPIDTIAFGTAEGSVIIRGQAVPVPSDPAAMARIAQESGGKSFTAKSANQLHAVYDQIGRAVGYVVHKHEVTAWFTGAALALAALAGAAALIWSSRLV